MDKLKACQNYFVMEGEFAQPDFIALDKEETADREAGNNNPQSTRTRALIVFQDVITRWWSTYRMIDRLLKLKKCMINCANPQNTMGYVQCAHHLSSDQWTMLEALQYVLYCFYKSMKLLEGDKYVSSSWVPVFVTTVRRRLVQGTNTQRMIKPATLQTPNREGVPAVYMFNPPMV